MMKPIAPPRARLPCYSKVLDIFEKIKWGVSDGN